jgi:hypothetical protein
MIPQATAGLSDDAQIHRTLEHGRSLMGPGWRCIESFDEVNEDAYEDDEEEVSAFLHLPASPASSNLRNMSSWT